MILCTYRIHYKGFPNERRARSRQFISDIYKDVLYRDKNWHFFLDWEGGTLRFSPKFEKRVRNYKWGNDISFKMRKRYIPSKDEYHEIRYVANDLQPLFHELSVLAAKYPFPTLQGAVFDRLTHTLINQMGIHDFRQEAYWLLNVAYQRARLQEKSLGLPKSIHKLTLWILSLTKWR